MVIPSNLQAESKKRFGENQFNIIASDLMALNRSIRDQRSAKSIVMNCFSFRLDRIRLFFSCHSHKFPSDLPTTSIVIVFHNEGNSTLLRTLTSIIIRSPVRFIHEIIMVDDASVERGQLKEEISSFHFYISFRFEFLEYLKETLENFVKDLPVPVHILRNEERLGLMKSRLKGKSKSNEKMYRSNRTFSFKGAEIAKGETLTFLDAHIECSPGWLEYLLYEVKKDR